MSQRALSLESLKRYLARLTQLLNTARQKGQAVQEAYKQRYPGLKQEHDLTLARLTRQMVDYLGPLHPELKQRFEAGQAKEREALLERRAELAQRIPKIEQDMDEWLGMARSLREDYQALTLKLNRLETGLKAKRDRLRIELAAVNDRIQELAGGMGVITNVLSIRGADKERQGLLKQLEEREQELRTVRHKWERTTKKYEQEQAELQQEWQKANRQVAQLRTEADYLQDDGRLDSLARRQAIYKTLDELAQPALAESGDLAADLAKMTELNHQTDAYYEGLQAVGRLVALLEGVSTGVDKLGESVSRLLSQQKRYSQYLSPLQVTVPQRADRFERRCQALIEQLNEPDRYSQAPQEFVEVVQPVLNGSLSAQGIKQMFEDFGQALEKATKGWR